MAIPELRRKMLQLGVPVNIKSLYRLTSADPLQKVDMRILGAICQTCHVGIQDVIDFGKPRLSLQKLEPSVQKRLEELMSKSNEGALNASERKEFETIAEQAHQMTLANARLLARQRRANRSAIGTRHLRKRPGLSR